MARQVNVDEQTGFGDHIESLTEILAHIDARVSVSFARRFTETGHSHGARQPQPRDGRQSSLAMLRGDRTRSFSTIGAYRKWCSHADSVGFPVGGMQMVLGVDAKNLHVFTSTFLLGRPKRLAGSVPLSSIAQFTVVRGLTKSRIALLYSGGAFIEFEAFSRRSARQLVDTAIAHRDA